jgi:hypothetical protein
VGLLLGYPAGIATAIWSRPSLAHLSDGCISGLWGEPCRLAWRTQKVRATEVKSALTPQPAPMRTTAGQVRTGIEEAPTRPSAALPVNTQAAASSGMLHVESRPSGAQVLLDDRPVATTPFRLYRLPSGFHTVRMELEGYRPFSTSVEIAGGSLVRVSASLEPDAAPGSR